jgi:hypothetical protein
MDTSLVKTSRRPPRQSASAEHAQKPPNRSLPEAGYQERPCEPCEKPALRVPFNRRAPAFPNAGSAAMLNQIQRHVILRPFPVQRMCPVEI